jgi:integrase
MGLGGYRIEKQVVRASKPRSGQGGGFTRQQVRWDVVAPNGAVVRSFKGRNGRARALDEIRRRGKRKAELTQAREEARAAGIVIEGQTSGKKMHMARHTAGQSVLDKTGNLKAVQKLLGHSSITTTGDIYTDWDIDQLEATMRDVVGEDET